MRRPTVVSSIASCAFIGSVGCAALPQEAPERGLYLDLRKVVQAGEDSGWTIDSSRLQANLEPALRSVCQVEPRTRAALSVWLSNQIIAAGGPAEAIHRRHPGDSAAMAESLALERVSRLLAYAEARAVLECPFWLSPHVDFVGVQGDFQRWVILAETQAFGTFMVPGNVPALGGGGRILLGRGLGPRTTLALGADLAASGTFIPERNHGIDAYVTLAAPVLFRWSEFAHLWDVELAPVMRFSPVRGAWPPGGRVEVGGGFSSVTLSSFASYFMFYAGYELHGVGTPSSLDQTFQIGTRIAVDWQPGRD